MNYSYASLRELTFTSLLCGISMCSQLLASSANAEGAKVAKPTAKELAAPKAHHGAVYVDPLGFALFGPSLGAEVAVGPVGFGATFRWFSPGLLGKALFLNGDDKFAFSYGAGLNAQYYFLSSLAGPHVGL